MGKGLTLATTAAVADKHNPEQATNITPVIMALGAQPDF
jgi:hypothetical protein